MISLLFRFFVLVSPLALFAAIVCTPQPDGSWICSGDGGAAGGGQVVTNVVGVCTNCTAMSPEDCQSIKNSIQLYLQEGMETLSDSRQEVNDSLSDIQSVLEEGDSFTPVTQWSASSGSGPVNTAPQFQYGLGSAGSSIFTGSYPLGGTANNSIVNYYQQAVKPSLQSAENHLYHVLFGINSTYNTLSSISDNVLSRVNCSACTASFDGDPLETNSPPSSGSCPCDEQMKALNKLVKDEISPRISSIDDNVKLLTNIVSIAREQFEIVKVGMHNISNLLLRLDDYVLDDFSQRVYQIRFDVNYIASNLRQRVSFIDQQYSNSTFYVSLDGEKDIDIQNLESQLLTDTDEGPSFDWGEYKNLTWFGRVEYLLLRMNGLYSLNDNETSSEDPSSRSDEIEESASSFNQSLDEAKSSFDSVKSSAANFFNAVDNAFGGSSMSNHPEIPLISNYLNTGEPLTLNIDQDVVDACRVVTSLLWTAGAAVLLFRIVIVFWMYTADVIWLLIKHITDTVK